MSDSAPPGRLAGEPQQGPARNFLPKWYRPASNDLLNRPSFRRVGGRGTQKSLGRIATSIA